MDNSLNSFKSLTPYRIPEGFFEQSKAQILATIADESARKTAKMAELPRRRSHRSWWMGIAAAVVVVAIVGGLSLPTSHSSSSALAKADTVVATSSPAPLVSEAAATVGLYAIAEDDDDFDAWMEFAEDDIFLQSTETPHL